MSLQRSRLQAPGDTAIITVYASEPFPENYHWYKYNPTDGWFDFSRELISGGLGDGAVINDDRTQAVLYITDNGGYDDNINDFIVKDPSGIGAVSSAGSDSGSGGGGCFIKVLNR